MVKKKDAKKKSNKKKALNKGRKFVCGFCGLEVTVDESCSCINGCDLMCCGTHLQPKK
ncbi:MAG: hypothetical protein JSU92_09860 [Deltaproteobacteria bacterium]|nr:MAG: hypothetical protein JSU92_09860 [Deltaproteobacteria bacterium]